MSVEQCNNCEIVERENIKLRKMIIGLHNQINIMNNTQGELVKVIAKAAGVKINFKKCTLPGEKSYSIEKISNET